MPKLLNLIILGVIYLRQVKSQCTDGFASDITCASPGANNCCPCEVGFACKNDVSTRCTVRGVKKS